MLRLARIVKNYQEAGALNGQINLYGFLSDQVFLTKSGELGVILAVRGVDYECLDGASIDALSKRLESAFRLFDENYRIYNTCSSETIRVFRTNSMETPSSMPQSSIASATSNRNPTNCFRCLFTTSCFLRARVPRGP